MANYERTSIYIGVTNDIERRVLEHKTGKLRGYTSQYRCYYLMYYEKFNNVQIAIEREKQLKNWRSKWKWNLVKEQNSDFSDLAEDWFD